MAFENIKKKHYYKNKKSVTIKSLPLGEKGKTKEVNTTETIQREQWVVKNNVDATNKVSNNTRAPEDKNKMYDGDVTEYSFNSCHYCFF